jgi:polyhydroxyalkanoate synthesis regulator phasin
MKFTVEVEEFYIEDGELAAELQKQVKADVVHQIRESVKKQVTDFMDQHIKAVIDQELKTRVQMLMDELLATGKVKDQYSSSPEMPIKEWITKYFTGKSADIHKSIQAQVNKHVSDLQTRYDIMFTSQLITKMKDQGFLKEDVVKILLGSSEGN